MTAGNVVMKFELDLPGVGVERTERSVPRTSATASVQPAVGGGRVVQVGATVRLGAVGSTVRINKTTGTVEVC